MRVPVLDSPYLRPKWKYRYASRPKRTTVRLARVRVWLEDPVTGEPTGFDQAVLIDRLNSCARLANWSLSHNAPFIDEPENVYGYWDELDEAAWERTPGRNPKILDEAFEVCSLMYMHKFLELRLAFRADAHPVSVDFVKRLCGCKLRDIVICDRRNLHGIPYEEQIRLWLADVDGDTDYEDVIMKESIYEESNFIDEDEVVLAHDGMAARDHMLGRDRAPEAVQTGLEAPVHEFDTTSLPPTFFSEGDVHAPDVMGHGIATENGEPLQLQACSPYALTYDELRLATHTPAGQIVDPNRVIDRSRDEITENGITVRSRIVTSLQTQHFGWADVDRNGEHPTSYSFDSGNGLRYELFGRWALICACEPDAEAMELIEQLPELKLWCESTRSYATCVPYDVLISAYAWAFPDCCVRTDRPKGGWFGRVAEAAGKPLLLVSDYARAWREHNLYDLGVTEDFLFRDNHAALRRESALMHPNLVIRPEWSDDTFDMGMFISNVQKVEHWDEDRMTMTDHPYHYLGLSLELEDEIASTHAGRLC